VIRALQSIDWSLFDPRQLLDALEARKRATAPRGSGDEEPPQGPIERAVAEAWQGVLGVAQVGRRDNFFALNGHSLHVARILAIFYEKYRVRIGFDEFSADPTLTGLSSTLKRALVERHGSGRSPPRPPAEVVASRPNDDGQPPRSVASIVAQPLDASEPSHHALARDVGIALREGSSGIRIEILGFLHCDRVEALGRGLSSFLERARKDDRPLTVVVADDSRSEASRRACHELVATSGAAREARYVGAAAKQSFVEALVARGLSRDALALGVLGQLDGVFGANSVGANRNALLLSTGRAPILCVDDDVICDPMGPVTRDDDLTVCAGRDPADYAFGEGCELALSTIDADPLAAHELLLGRTIVDCDGSGISPPPPLGPLVARLRAGGRVLLTAGGLVGDCGWGSPSTYLTGPFTKQARMRLIGSRATYEEARRSRRIARAVTRPTVADASWLMTTAVGLDARSLLPPFLPLGRGEDVVFGRLLERIHHGACIGHVPIALRHEPVSSRRFSPGEILRSASGFDLYELAIAAIDAPKLEGDDPSDRLRALGEALVGLGQSSLGRFEAYLAERMTATRQRSLAQLEAQLESHGRGNPAWASDVDHYLAAARDALATTRRWVPLDLATWCGWPAEETLVLAQRFLALFGEILCLWPTITSFAEELGGFGDAYPA
jgi:hypothetical protein